jgi:DNA-directed RNA polymerase subunit E"
MAKEKVCKKCKVIVEGNECPICKGTAFSNLWQGQVNVLDPEKSTIAQKMGLTHKGRYAIKVR